MLTYNKNLKQYSRELRKNMTDAERLLWSKIKGKQLENCQFYRQKIIGSYIADFYCPKAKLVVELDGGQHYSCSGEEEDAVRDSYMASIGLKVQLISDRDVIKNLNGVMEKIWMEL